MPTEVNNQDQLVPEGQSLAGLAPTAVSSQDQLAALPVPKVVNNLDRRGLWVAVMATAVAASATYCQAAAHPSQCPEPETKPFLLSFLATFSPTGTILLSCVGLVKFLCNAL